MLASDFKSLTTPFEVTQYLRGTLYIYVDFLMTLEYPDEDVAIPEVVGFFKLVVKLIARWLTLWPNYMQAVRSRATGSSWSGRRILSSPSSTATSPSWPANTSCWTC